MPGSSIAEFNTIITMLGMLCATVQFMTGFYAFFYKKKKYLIKGNDLIFRAHRGFGGLATAFYLLGLFAGLSGFLGSLIFLGSENFPPLEPTSPSYLIHVIGSFPTMVIILFKTYLSYFHKKTLYRRMKYLGPATFISWGYTWVTAAISYYLRTQPLPTHPDPHSAPLYLLAFEWAWLQLLMPFILGFIIGYLIVRKADKIEKKKAAEKSKK